MSEDNDESSRNDEASMGGIDTDCLDIEKVAVECLCPKCGIRHVIQFSWTGRGIPRKFCPQCRKSV